MNPSITRRAFLKKSLAGAGMTLAISVSPFGLRPLSAQELQKDLFSPNAWLQITPDNIVTVIVNKCEMGQGVYTSLPMILAEELEADWKQVRVKGAPARDEYKDPVFGMQLTAGSTSIRHMFEPLRKAGAAAREMLVSAAAETWGVPPGECEARQGWVRHRKSTRKLSYGELCDKASKLPIPENPPLRRDYQFKLIGTRVPRLDLQEKIDGEATFGIDVFIPDMLYAAISRPPAYGAKIVSYENEAARKIPGVQHVIVTDRGIAVCAKTIDGAWKGRMALNAQWDKGSHPDLSSETLEKDFLEHLNQPGLSAKKEGNIENALDRAAKKLEAIYLLPYLYHATLEPMNCTAHVRQDRCDLWVPTQFQSGVLMSAEKITGLKPEQIHIHTTYLGGGFGRRAELDVVEEALQISKATGKPIKLIWTREEDVKNDFYRPGNCCRIEAGLDQQGRIMAWSHKVVVPSIFARFFPQMVKDGIDPAAVEGISDMAYEIPNLNVEYVKIDTPIPVGFWRSVGHSHNAFTVESFIDELAYLAKRDPLEFRMSHLRKRPRAQQVLRVAAERAGWGKPLRKGHGRGIAYHYSFGSHVVHVAEVSVDKTEGKIKVRKVVCAIDCGPVVNLDTVKAQIEGATLFGLSAALMEKIQFSNGGVENESFYNYELIRMSDVPEIEVNVLRSREKLGGVGEPGVPPIAPAVANAVFNASGIRVRGLPMTPETILEAMKKG
jgi:isoquinoline 1-oxidoreductase beta subunit